MQHFLEENLRKPISPQLSAKSTSGYAEFCKDLIASRDAEQPLEILSKVFIFSLGPDGRTERKIK